MRDQILTTLLKGSPLTSGEIAERLDADPTATSKACSALLGQGLLFPDGDKARGGVIVPAWGLTSAGEYAAREARAQMRAAELMGTEKTGHDSRGEVPR